MKVSEITEIIIEDDLMACLSKTPSEVIIGISSTKQDVLARKIDLLFRKFL